MYGQLPLDNLGIFISATDLDANPDFHFDPVNELNETCYFNGLLKIVTCT